MTLSKREQDKLVVDNLGSTYRFATVFWKSHRDLELDDCKSEAMFASIMAAQKYDPEKGKQFSTFLFLVIKRRLLNLARDTLAIQSGMTAEDASDYFSTSIETIQSNYWHHSPSHQVRAVAQMGNLGRKAG